MTAHPFTANGLGMRFTGKERRNFLLEVCASLLAAVIVAIISFSVRPIHDWLASTFGLLLVFGRGEVAIQGWLIFLLVICSPFGVIQLLAWIGAALRPRDVRLFRSLSRDERVVLKLLARSDFGLTEGVLCDEVPVPPQRFLYFIDRLVNNLALAERIEPASGGAFWSLSPKGREVATANNLFA